MFLKVLSFIVRGLGLAVLHELIYCKRQMCPLSSLQIKLCIAGLDNAFGPLAGANLLVLLYLSLPDFQAKFLDFNLILMVAF